MVRIAKQNSRLFLKGIPFMGIPEEKSLKDASEICEGAD
jgi:hypothetical protein